MQVLGAHESVPVSYFSVGRRYEFRTLFGGQTIYVKPAIEVVGFVVKTASQDSGSFDLDRRAGLVSTSHDRAEWPAQVGALSQYREAAFIVVDQLAFD